MATSEHIIRKIHKLLQLSRDRSESSINEAEAALRRAQYLLEKYELDMSEIEDYFETHMCEELFFEKQKLSVWDKYILNILQEFFHVEILVAVGGKYVIVGSKDHIDVARMIYEYLKDIFVKSFREYRKIHKRAQSQAYYMGLYAGLYNVLQAHIQQPLDQYVQQSEHVQNTEQDTEHSEHNECTALAIYDRAIDEYLKERYGEVPKTRKKQIEIYDRQAFFRGEEAGQRINIKRSIPHAV